jgi:predicted permease
VLAYTFALAMVTGLVFGLLPAIRHSAPQLAVSPHRRSTQGTLVVVEIATAMTLLVGGGLLIRSFTRLAQVDLGFDPERVLTFQIGLTGSRNRPGEMRAFAEGFVERLHGAPGILDAAYARQLPLVQLYDQIALRTGGDSADTRVALPLADARFVSRDYMRTMNIRIVAGRGLEPGDGAGRPGVMIVNETMARQAFPNQNAIGRIVLAGPRQIPYEFVGIAADIHQLRADRDPGPQYFVDMRQMAITNPPSGPPPFPLGAYYVVRASGDVASTMAVVRTAAHQLEPQSTIDNVATMERIGSNSLTRPRLFAVLTGIFAGIAAALAAIGLYGVMAYSVAQRTREIGIRIALGARRAAVLRLVLGQSTLLIIIGLAIGLVGAWSLTRALQGMLFGVTPFDPLTIVTVAGAFASVALLAAYLPARRATTVDPSEALRAE